jgi:hypothetical protein
MHKEFSLLHHWILGIGLVVSLLFLAYLLLTIPSATVRSFDRERTLARVSQTEDISELRAFSSGKIMMLSNSCNISGFLLRGCALFSVVNVLLFSAVLFLPARSEH